MASSVCHNRGMIVTLTGVVSEKLADMIVLETAGVGYGLAVTMEDFGRLAAGQTAKVYVHEHIREAVFDLYGFLELDTKRLFDQLLAVNGIGPKMALNVLSIGTAVQVRVAIANGNTKFIQSANGVGKRVAERIVVELKDKVGLVGIELTEAGLLQSETQLLQDEAVEALAALGFAPTEAAKALEGVDPALATEDRVRLALKRKG